MEQTLTELDKVQIMLSFEKERYKKAIRDNKPFEEIKVIYLMIKELQKQENQLMKKSIDKFENKEPS